MPTIAPTLAEVVTTVEQVEGVRFGTLFERLPRCAPDGDAAIQAVWQMALELKKQMEEEKE